jgi:hypothetical protein
MKERFDSQDEIDRDFSIYESGILRLKDLENRLNHLNTLGFWKLEKKIRSKLKKVGEIPRIEAELDLLEKKVLQKRGKKDLYKKVWKPLKKKKAKKKEVIVGDVPEPIEAPKFPAQKEKPLVSRIFGAPGKENKQKKYEQEIKGAIGNPKKNIPIVVDSVNSQEIKKKEAELKQEKAKLEAERKEFNKKQLIQKNQKKYYPVRINVGDYSTDSQKATEAIMRLRKLHEKKGFFKKLRS